MNNVERILASRKLLKQIQTRPVFDEMIDYSTTQVEVILSSALLEGDWRRVEWATLRLSRNLSNAEIEIFFEARLASCDYELVKHAASVTRIQLTTNLIDSLAVAGILVYQNVKQAVELYERGKVSSGALEPLIGACVEVGLPETAKHFATVLGRELTSKEITTAQANEAERLDTYRLAHP